MRNVWMSNRADIYVKDLSRRFTIEYIEPPKLSWAQKQKKILEWKMIKNIKKWARIISWSISIFVYLIFCFLLSLLGPENITISVIFGIILFPLEYTTEEFILMQLIKRNRHVKNKASSLRS